MSPAKFNNAMVAAVSAYAEALGEVMQLNDQLQQALKHAAPAGPRAAAVIAAARVVTKGIPPELGGPLKDALLSLVVALAAMDAQETRHEERR